MSSDDTTTQGETGPAGRRGGDPRAEPGRRRRIAVTAAVLGAVAVGFYTVFILVTAAQG